MNCPNCDQFYNDGKRIDVRFGCDHTWHLDCVRQFDIRQSDSYKGSDGVARSFFEKNTDKCPKCVRYCDKFTRWGRCPRGDECLFYHPDEKARAEIMKGGLIPKQRPSLPQEYKQNPGLVKALMKDRDEWRKRALRAEAELMSCQSQLVSMGKNNEVLERKCGEEKKNKIPGAKKNLEGQVQAGYPSQTSLGAVVPDVAAVSDSRSQ
eukprot:gnl/MRDRNA2_/MRDRNA2_66208_c0_seq2.p1 gnl/MRDRNA2_/MRDRNA2_66208_c0~~gnl/MRDRNA2_/MRDRNA2_66208_c0_seq2.p1  ORF type:complete len:207 (-),score=34.84 gnl/MRDRNA2_/MRDRNA2_66208_c0_seq2:109-729(-)